MRDRICERILLQSYDYSVVVAGFLMKGKLLYLGLGDTILMMRADPTVT